MQVILEGGGADNGFKFNFLTEQSSTRAVLLGLLFV